MSLESGFKRRAAIQLAPLGMMPRPDGHLSIPEVAQAGWVYHWFPYQCGCESPSIDSHPLELAMESVREVHSCESVTLELTLTKAFTNG